MEHVTQYKTWYDLLFKQRNVLIDLSMMVIGVGFLALMSQLYIPLWPVPITGQTFGIFTLAFFFGSRKGLMTIAMYVLAGIIGVGVFAKQSSGIGVIVGPTGGYILGFLVCVFVVGYAIEKGHCRTRKSIICWMVIGNLIIYGIGLAGLWRHFPDAGLLGILMMGVIPFLIGDAIKIAVAAGLFPYLWKGSEKFAVR